MAANDCSYLTTARFYKFAAAVVIGSAKNLPELSTKIFNSTLHGLEKVMTCYYSPSFVIEKSCTKDFKCIILPEQEVMLLKCGAQTSYWITSIFITTLLQDIS